jgi:multiple sugar transport system permease protein
MGSRAVEPSAPKTLLGSWAFRRQVGRVVLHAVLIPLALIFSVPFVWLLSTSLKTVGEVFITPIEWIPKNPQWENFVEIFTILPLSLFIRNTIIVTVLATLGNVVSSLIVGYSLGRLRWPGRELVFSLVLATMMLPGIVVLVPQFIIFFRLKWVDTFLPLIVPSWFGGSFYIFLLRQFMRGLPIELDESARLDGAGSLRILGQIIAPLCKPAIAAVTIFSALAHYNEFMGPLLYLTNNEKFTIPLGLYWYQGRFGQFWHLVMAASTVAVVPLVILFFTAQRYFIQGFTFSGLAGR